MVCRFVRHPAEVRQEKGWKKGNVSPVIADKVSSGVGGTGDEIGRRSQQSRAVGRQFAHHPAQVLSLVQRVVGVQRHDVGLPESGQPRRSRRPGNDGKN